MSKAETCTHVVIIHANATASCAPIEEVFLHTPYHINEEGKLHAYLLNYKGILLKFVSFRR